MKTNDCLLEDCMIWMTDLSTFRCRINKLYQQLQTIKSKLSLEGRYQEYIAVAQGFQNASRKIGNIETKVVYVMKKEMNALHDSSSGKMPQIENEEELFDSMMQAHRMVIELQHSFYDCLKEKETKDPTSLVIDMPRAGKALAQQRS